MNRPRLLDLFCGAGGAAMGYHRAGFDVVGVDIKPQPNYPFEFVQADALEYLAAIFDEEDWFDAIHASPPCQVNVRGLAAVNDSIHRVDEHVDLIGPTRELLRKSSAPWVIENVVGSSLEAPVQICGSSLGLPIRRHRLFESSIHLLVPPCVHGVEGPPRYWNGDRSRRRSDGSREYVGNRTHTSRVVQIYGNAGGRDEWPAALGIDWMTAAEMTQAIPPAYTELIGHQLLARVLAGAA